ncbi:MAG: TauD/TfdA family dioxygenase [Alphaproteobacteria bacterium]|nr:TauD/TfdA family dioxygenase [Alphaproteobacteria bacterium]
MVQAKSLTYLLSKILLLYLFVITSFVLHSFALESAANENNHKIIKEFTLDKNIRKEFEVMVEHTLIDPYENPHIYSGIAGKTLEKLLPNELKKEIRLMDEGGADLIIIHNFPIDSHIPITPKDSTRPPSKFLSDSNLENAKGFVSEASILGLGYFLDAAPFYKKEEKDGTVINQIISIKNDQYKSQRSSYGSSLELFPHTENVYQVPPLKYFTLLCLRGDPKVATSLIFFDDMLSYIKKLYPQNTQKIIRIMKQPLFIMSSGPSHGNSKSQSILPIIENTEKGETIFRLNLNPERTVGTTPEAEEVVTLLRKVITSKDFRERYYKRIYLSEGDLILFNNWRVMHARDAFEIDPKYWRWLQRCYFRK